MSVSSRLLLLRVELTKRRAARERRRRLERDIACFSTAAERDELVAILDRQPDGATSEIRDILARQTARPPHRPRPGPGMRPAP